MVSSLTRRDHQRRRPAHPPSVELPGAPLIVFLTVCSASRKRIFADKATAQTIVESWQAADAWHVGRYVIMPDHVHLFCSPGEHSVPLTEWVQYWKSLAARCWPRRADHPIWQRDFWDRQLRKDEHYAEKWEYVRRNPVRHGLVMQPEDWPYTGELHPLTW